MMFRPRQTSINAPLVPRFAGRIANDAEVNVQGDEPQASPW
jgi:hypothetical protein